MLLNVDHLISVPQKMQDFSPPKSNLHLFKRNSFHANYLYKKKYDVLSLIEKLTKGLYGDQSRY